MKRQETTKKSEILLYIFLLAVAFSIFYLSSAEAQYNYDHVNVTTKVNITNSYPEILNISLDSSIVLNAGGSQTVYCNATIRDWNGHNDINETNATFYHYLNESIHSDDNNEHYTNGSCTKVSNDGSYLANYSCTFEVQYYANNGTWNCNITARDQINFTDSFNDSTSINPLYALNVTDEIDYGNLSVTEYSNNITANVTNFGNMAINVSVLGYGQTQGDGIGLVCEYGDNITVDNERFYASLVDWSTKYTLSGTNQDINATLNQQQNDGTPVVQSTYWQLYVPPNPFGYCTGVVRFTATTP